MDKKILFAATAAVQVLAILAIAARYEYVDRYGTEILVPAFGYDPVDVFRWQYANVTYWPVSSWTGALDFKPETGGSVYVSPEISSTGTFVAVKSVTDSKPEGLVIKARIAGYDFWKPEYRYASLPTSSAVPVSGTFVNEFEYPYADSRTPDSAMTKFSVGSGAIAGLSETGTVVWLYGDLNECASGLESYSWSVKAVPMPATDNAAYEARQKEYREKCRSFPQVSITSVNVPRILRLDYSADRLFIEEGSGRPVESALSKGWVLAVWHVSPSWKVVLHGLKIGNSIVK